MGEQFLCGDEVALSEALQQIGAENILILGSRERWQLNRYLHAGKATQIVHVSLDEIEKVSARQAHYDCILVAEILENMNKLQARVMLAILMQLSDQVFVRVQLGKSWLKQVSLWEPQDMRSMGYELREMSAENGRPVGMFHYDVHTYKTRTEWLNSKFWAQPD